MVDNYEEANKKSIEEVQEEVQNKQWEELKGYYPQFFNKEGHFEFDKFKGYLTDSNISVTTDGSLLNFVGKEYAKLLIDMPTDTLISPNESDNKQGVNADSKNIYLIGDNIDVLKHLRKSYTNKIDVIYIDPPYNTGSDDFTYPDTFQFSIEKLTEIFDDEEKAERIYNLSGKSSHSAWLTFMLPRVAIAYKLLKNEGVMFVSLDDNEASNMTLLCDELFGESNRLGPIIQNKQNSKNDTKNIQKNHEYVLVYRKSAKTLENGKEKESIQVISRKKQEVFEENGEFYYFNDYITTRGEGGTLAKRKNLGYTVYYKSETNDMIPKMDYDKEKIGIVKSYEELYTNDEELISKGYFPIRPPKVRKQFGVWTWELDKFIRDKKEVIVTGSKPNYNIKKRTFVESSEVLKEDEKHYIEMDITSNSRSILDFSTNAGTTYLNELMDETDIFTNPKNVDLLKYLLCLIPEKESLVLDFFSGSGTTADAVMRLNADNKGNHNYILVQLPEPISKDNPAREKFGFSTIDEIGRERIKRAAIRIKEETGNDIDYGFKTYYVHKRLVPTIESIEEFSDDSVIQESLGLGTEKHLDIYRYKEASGKATLLTTWLIDDGFGFSANIEEIGFGEAKGYISGSRLYILDEGMTTDDLVELLRKIHAKEINVSNITVYVHSLSTVVLRELDLALKTINGMTLERRY